MGRSSRSRIRMTTMEAAHGRRGKGRGGGHRGGVEGLQRLLDEHAWASATARWCQGWRAAADETRGRMGLEAALALTLPSQLR